MDDSTQFNTIHFIMLGVFFSMAAAGEKNRGDALPPERRSSMTEPETDRYPKISDSRSTWAFPGAAPGACPDGPIREAAPRSRLLWKVCQGGVRHGWTVLRDVRRSCPAGSDRSGAVGEAVRQAHRKKEEDRRSMGLPGEPSGSCLDGLRCASEASPGFSKNERSTGP